MVLDGGDDGVICRKDLLPYRVFLHNFLDHIVLAVLRGIDMTEALIPFADYDLPNEQLRGDGFCDLRGMGAVCAVPFGVPVAEITVGEDPADMLFDGVRTYRVVAGMVLPIALVMIAVLSVCVYRSAGLYAVNHLTAPAVAAVDDLSP